MTSALSSLPVEQLRGSKVGTVGMFPGSSKEEFWLFQNSPQRRLEQGTGPGANHPVWCLAPRCKEASGGFSGGKEGNGERPEEPDLVVVSAWGVGAEWLYV